MKKNILKAAALSLPLAFGTAIADEATGPLLVADGIDVTPISDVELDNIQGMAWDFCAFCALSNNAHVAQANVSLLSAFVIQGNGSHIHQSNN